MTLTIGTDSIDFAPVKLDLENLTVKPMDDGARKRLYLDFQYRTVVGYVARDFSFCHRGSRNVFLGTLRRDLAEIEELEHYLSTELVQAQLAAIVDGRDEDQSIEQSLISRIESLGQTLPSYWDARDWFQTVDTEDLFPATFDGQDDSFEALVPVKLAEAKRMRAHLDAGDVRRELARRWHASMDRVESLFEDCSDEELFEGVDTSSLEAAVAGIRDLWNFSPRSVVCLRAYVAVRYAERHLLA